MSLDSKNLANVSGPASGLRLTALPIESVISILRKVGAKQISADCIRADQAAGAPVNADGTINLLAYSAWMLQQIANKEGGHV
jgi:hypothetical protein